MDPASPVDSPAAAERAVTHQPFRGRASGTRRIVPAERSAVVSSAPDVQPSEPGSLQRAFDGLYMIDQRLRGRLMWLLVSGAAAVGGAVPLVMSWTGVELLGAPGASALQLSALLLAGLTWVARCRPKGGAWQLDSVRSRLRALPRRAALDARSVARAPKSLKLSILSGWALVTGLVGLASASVLGAVAQLLGHALTPALAGSSLWSVSLLLLAVLLRSALRVQAPRSTEATLDLALAAREFAPVIDLSAPLEIESVFLEPTPLHRVLEGLASWQHAGQWHAAEDHATALQHHLWATNMPDARLERQHRLTAAGATGIVDLLVEDAVLVDFQLGLERTDVARLAERVRSYRVAYRDNPIVIVLCNATATEPPTAAMLESVVAELGSAPLLIAVSR